MNAHNEQQWPEYLMLRDTGLYDDAGGLGQHIFTTAGAGYVKQKYVRADLAAQPSPVVKQNLTTQPAAAQEAVAYLDIGAGGYIDLGSDLSDEQLLALPKGRHALAIIGTFGIDGYVAAPVAAAPACQACEGHPSGANIPCAVCKSTPAAPGIDHRNLISSIQSMRDRMMAVLVPKFGEAFDGDFDTMLEAINALKRIDASINGGSNAMSRAYGYLWHVNHPEDIPTGHPFMSADRAAVEARKELRDMLTHEQRGEGINCVRKKLLADMQATSAEDGSSVVRGGHDPSCSRYTPRYVVLKASGSRYAYVNDTEEGRTVKRYDIFKGNGWERAEKHCAALNKPTSHGAGVSDA